MKKVLFFVAIIALVGVVATAAAPKKGVKIATPANIGQTPGADRALQMIDYWNTASAMFYTWNGNMYMSNLFKPTAGWYPLDVVALEVYAARLDGSTATGNAGTLNGLAVFDPAGTLLQRELAVPLTVATWTLVPLTTLPRINTGNFYGGIWNDTADGALQCTATGWTAPPTEPFECVTAGTAATAGGAGPWVANGCGAAYGTVSAASVRAQVNTNVPVELMRFNVE